MIMKEINRKQRDDLHNDNRYRPKYPTETVVQFVFRNFNRDGKTKVLDLGCGAGRHVFFMGKENIVPYGVDFSDEGIRYTKELLCTYGMGDYAENMQVASLTKLPYEDQFFDGIVCYGVLYYLDFASIKKAIKEMERVLKPNGKILLVVRTTEDYRYNKDNELPEEKNTVIINEENEGKCAHSENGMLMHFFEEQELRTLFSQFKNVSIDIIKESHHNQQYCDSNYVVVAER